ncbi:hypothetical protein Q5P01_023188 [Channa striata]|uniref:Fibronectin type-III domain-containing protein n=1 Tax=Channa striata TaxID=64152 RepID=A0AA88ISX1_CHASR|nr:hypothetical protein Q5P01_023188 [Channa striata]
MVRSWTPRMKLLMLLLLLLLLSSASVICPHVAGGHNLHCVTDYLFTINCSLTITPLANASDSNYSYWLTLTQDEEETVVCHLTKSYGYSSCSVVRSGLNQDIFTDLDTFEISLCHKQNDEPEICEMLDNDFTPYTNIKPNAPCCLRVTHNSSKHHFSWKSTYEEYRGKTRLVENLEYQLYYYKTGEKQNERARAINTESTNYLVDDQEFVPDTEYTARVRASPNQAFFMGNCSDWSTEVQWRTESAMNDLPLDIFVLDLGKKVFIPLCVMVPLVLFLCYAPVVKWRQSSFIPTPAPYFHTLYRDCQGDFKSWVVTPENSDMLKAEETLQIDTLTKCAEVQEEESHPHHQLMEGSAYSNIMDPACDLSLLGVPYTVSSMDQLSPQHQTLISPPGSPAEGDSGCWLCSDLVLEKDPPWYCNEYCTLSTFQQASPPTAEHESSCPQAVIRADATRVA